MSKSLYLLMILFFMVALGGCNDNEDISVPKHATTYAVKMGGIFPFTGALSEAGKPFHYSALLAIKHLADAGYPVGWAVADSKTDPEFGVKAAHELIEKGKVQVLTVFTSSSTAIAIAEQVSIANQVPLIASTASAPKITKLAADEGQDLLFRLVPSDTLQGTVLAKLAFDTGYRHVSLLFVDNVYGHGLNEVFTEQFKALGGTVVAAVPHQEVVPSTSFEGGISYINELQEAAYKGNPEALIVISYPEHAKVYLREAIENNLFKKFLFAHASRHHLLIDAIGAENLEGMCGTAPGGEETESTKKFRDSYKAEYGEAPTNLYQRHMYDAVFVAGLAAYAAQAIGEEVTSLAIRDYLRRVNDPDGQKVIPGSENLKRAMKMLDSGLTINYEGASGNVDFDENGDVITPIEIWCFEGGKIVHKENVQPDV